MSLDYSFHSQVEPTDVVKAVDNAGSVDTLADTFIFGRRVKLWNLHIGENIDGGHRKMGEKGAKMESPEDRAPSSGGWAGEGV